MHKTLFRVEVQLSVDQTRLSHLLADLCRSCECHHAEQLLGQLQAVEAMQTMVDAAKTGKAGLSFSDKDFATAMTGITLPLDPFVGLQGPS